MEVDDGSMRDAIALLNDVSATARDHVTAARLNDSHSARLHQAAAWTALVGPHHVRGAE